MQALRAIDSNSFTRRGFTLVELMVSIAVLAVLVMMLTSAFNAASRAWISGEGNTERQRSARALADFISAELQGALVPIEGKSAAAGSNLQFVINPPSLSAFHNGDSIFWQAPIATESSFGDVAEIGYFVRWVETETTRKPVLCRFFVNPSDRDSSGDLIPHPDFHIYGKDAGAWLTEDLLNELAPGDENGKYLGLFAENVVGLWIQAYGLDGKDGQGGASGKDELPKPFDSQVGYVNNFKVGNHSWPERRYLPAKVRVSLAQIDSNHAARLGPVWEQVQQLTRDTGSAAEFIEQLRHGEAVPPALQALLPGIRIYSTDVYLENGR